VPVHLIDGFLRTADDFFAAARVGQTSAPARRQSAPRRQAEIGKLLCMAQLARPPFSNLRLHRMSAPPAIG
jgi:hypothetical protein